MALIECKEICKNFGEKVALDHVSLSVPKGQIFGLLGPNGAGKTTMIRIINRITIPNSGEVYFDGRPVTQRDVEKIGYLPEERGLYRKMEVGEQAMYLAQLKGMSAKDAQAELKKWFIKFGIQDWWKKKVEELSKGMAQKVQGATIILSTHNMESVEELCDNIALINKSKLVITGGVEEIRRKYGNNHVELICSGESALEPVPGLFSVLSDVNDNGRHTAVLSLEKDGLANDVLTAVMAQHYTVHSFKELLPRMNDIFIKLVTEGI